MAETVSPQNENNKKISLLLEDLSSLEDYIHDLFAFSPLPTCFSSPLGVILEANPAFEKISNFDFEEIVGEPIKNLFNKEEIEKLAQDTLTQGFVDGREMKFYPAKKEEIITQAFTRARKDENDNTVGFFLALLDLSEMKGTEKELKNAQTALLNILEDTEEARKEAEGERAKTQTIIANFTDGLLVFDREGKLSLVNPQAQKMLKVSEKNVIGKHILMLKKITSFKPLLKFFNEKGTKKQITLQSELTVEATAVSIGRRIDAPEMSLLILHDVTKEKELEEMKVDFASIAAHELRTPITSVRGYLSLVLENKYKKLTEDDWLSLDRAYQSSERLSSLIESLLSITRVERGTLTFHPEPLPIEKCIYDVSAEFKPQAEEKKQNITFITPKKPLPLVFAEELKLKEILRNFLSNAIKYTQEKGKIKVSTEFDEKWVTVHIKDDGPGIPAEAQPHLFKKFLRGEDALRKESEGVGLGLYIVKSLTELQGGTVWFKSQEGKGTTFSFKLPRSDNREQSKIKSFSVQA